jgi:HK97 family phage prohead protease
MKKQCQIGMSCYAETNGIDLENKVVPVILSDETKVMRFSWDDGVYYLSLSHDEGAVDLARASILPILLQHNTDMLPLGIYENVRLEDGKLKANARFDSEDALAMEIFGKMSRGFMQTFSVGVTILSKTLIAETVTGEKTYLADSWQITEASVVSVPAIPSAKVGLSDETIMGATMPSVTLCDKKIAPNSHEGNPMEFNKTNFEALLAEKAGFDKKLETLEATVAEGTVALEAEKAEIVALTAKMDAMDATAQAFKVESETRIREALSIGVDADTAIAMLSAETAEKASQLALQFKQSDGGTHQGDNTPPEPQKMSLLDYAKANKGSIK